MVSIGGTKVATFLPNRLVTTSGKRGRKTLYLTFDDGPHPQFTIPICELLDKHSAKATFFCVGLQIEQYPKIARHIISQGHLIANHSNTHKMFKTQSYNSQLNEVLNCQDKIVSLNPTSLKLFRAPQGHLSIPLCCQLLLEKWRIIHWSYDTLDYKHGPLEEQLSVFRKKPITDGDILLFHDDHQLAIDLLEVLLPKWKNLGYNFATVLDLL